MRQSFDLSTLSWTLTGWHPYHWEPVMKLQPDVGPLPAVVPGSVQQALRTAGLLPDWNVGLNCRQCEWVEHRDWAFQAELPAAWIGQGRALLICQGLDYQGLVTLGQARVGSFQGSLLPHTFDLTPHLAAGERRLTILFTGHPRYLGQIGYTSQVRDWKPRFNYIWDWVFRLVQVGIWDGLCLQWRQGDAIAGLRAYTDYDYRTGRGRLHLAAELELEQAAGVEVAVAGAAGEVARQVFPPSPDFQCALPDLPAAAWHPNGSGEQPLYQVSLRLLAPDGALLDQESRTVGFRQVTWRPCPGAPAGAEPWVCELNGLPTFLQGVNWSPIRPNFADVPEAEYQHRLQTYRDLGCNLLRVWGGAFLEKECFYRRCDELGLLVWQEFPLSSSGVDNWPPDDAPAIREMRQIAASYISRRQHHPSLLLWCGGNELLAAADGSRQGMDRPLDASHPMLAALQEVSGSLDPTRRFLPCSPSGPRTWMTPEQAGQGLHHDVHGPWNHAGSLEGWQRCWDADDALFHSELGMPGSSPASLIREYGRELAWPGNRDNPFWTLTGGWWVQWEDYLAQGGDAGDLEAYVRWSQARQAQALAYAARACKRRFPACSGLLFWMGHDCCPCPVNTALLDFEGHPKPAALALAEVFRARHRNLAGYE